MYPFTDLKSEKYLLDNTDIVSAFMIFTIFMNNNTQSAHYKSNKIFSEGLLLCQYWS